MMPKKIRLKEVFKDERAKLLYSLLSVDQPEHRLYPKYLDINKRLRQLGTVPGMLTVDDVHRVAAQVLLETWLVGMESIDRMGIDGQERLLVWQNDPDGGDPYCVTLDVMQALSYTPSESTLALEEAMAAWPVSARQRRALHERQKNNASQSAVCAGVAEDR